MTTMQTVLDIARVPLNDTSKDRYLDADMLNSANAAIALTYKVRPDLSFGSYGTTFTPLALTDTFPLPYQFVQAIADYVVFRAETGDDEHINSNRAVTFETMFGRELATL